MRRKIIGATVGTTINPDKFGSGGVTVTDEQVASAVEKYLEEHPEATTTVQDESISEEKLTAEVRAKLNSSQKANGLTTAQINALDGMFKVCTFIKDDVSAEYNAFKTAFGIGGEVEPDEPDVPIVPDEPEKTLTNISATYSGGSVTAGTSVNALTGIVVTAHYSDGSTETVTGYTLSGTIAEGSNTITVSYGGKTTTFTVTGVAESGGDEAGVSNEATWTDGVAYTYELIQNEYVEKTGAITPYSGWHRTPYLYCDGASKLRIEVIADNSGTNVTNNGYNAFYDENKNFISAFEFAKMSTAGAYSDIDIPTNAKYFIMSHKSLVMTTPYIKFIPYA